MLRFKGGKAHAHVLHNAATTYVVEHNLTSNGHSNGEKRLPSNVPGNEAKRVKRENPNGLVESDQAIPLELNVTIDFELDNPIQDELKLQMHPGMEAGFIIDFTVRKTLRFRWAKLCINWSQECALGLEVAMPRILTEHQDLVALFALARGCRDSYIASNISSVRLTNPATVTLQMQAIVQPNCPQDILYALLQYAFRPAPAPLHYTLEQFYQHLQPHVSNNLATKYIASELRPRLLPFQSQNVQWMVRAEINYGVSVFTGMINDFFVAAQRRPFCRRKSRYCSIAKGVYQ
jgi:hypothetical protein